MVTARGKTLTVRALTARARESAGRYGAALIEQACWSILNFGLNLALARFAAPDQYGALVFWTNCGFVLVSLQNALTTTHISVLAPGAATDPHRLETERLMHGVQAAFLLLLGLATLAASLLARGAFRAPAAALFLPAFLAQQYLRSLAFSRGRAGFAAVQSAVLLAVTAGLLGAGLLLFHVVRAEWVLALMALAYAVVALPGALVLGRGQWSRAGRPDLREYGGFARQAAWVFLGVSSSEVLARFYSFIVATWYGAAPLATLSATQILLRPVPLLATTWGMVARPDLARHRDAGRWGAFSVEVVAAILLGTVIALVWSGGIAFFWPALCRHLFAGKYGQFGWMVALWGVSGALNLIQTALNVALQALKAFKLLALANAAASLVAAAAIVAVMKLYGYGGAIAGTAAGQLLEAVIMAILLTGLLRRAMREGACFPHPAAASRPAALPTEGEG
jgi:O-antigen/teichoic acid export membrane protein